jgi:hypothetical protein
MAPRLLEISPKDVIWDNMAISWWQEWIRSAGVAVVVFFMIVLWSIPVAFTASLSQLDSLVEKFPWLQFLADNGKLEAIAKSAVGVLPPLLLVILLLLVPLIFEFLAQVKGCKTGAQKAEFVQRAFFAFLFTQVFLVVSIASFFAASLDDIFAKVSNFATSPGEVLNLLADNLPKAANYFFSYMILQAMSTSSGTLLQVMSLLTWYIIARIFDTTARHKWTRNTQLSQVKWGSFFPVYTNFACIALIYSVVAPLISIFAIITFSLFWVAQRYSMLYVTRFVNDTGGILYPRAINQTFTGLYVMELCLTGLFFIVRDEQGNGPCKAHGITMIVTIALTLLYQILLNRSFGPLLQYLPVTFEDEAVLRDEAFQRAQDQRLGLLHDDESEESDRDDNGEASKAQDDGATESSKPRRKHHHRPKFATLNPVKTIGGWAKKEHAKSKLTFPLGKAQNTVKTAAEYRRRQRLKDVEAQRAIGEALFGGYHDEIEDLTPEERNMLVKLAFQHYALRARRPTVWVPRDDIGVSDDEIRRTREFSDFIWISNEGTALDHKVRVVYGRNPPDFSEIDLIDL